MELQGLIYNAALLLTGSIIHSFVVARWLRTSRLARVVEGFLYGIMAILAMSAHITIVPGVIFDSRSVIVSLGGLFGGPVVAVISGLIAIAYRIYLGGAGAFTGVGSLVLSAGLGILYRHQLKGHVRDLNPLQLLGFGLVVNGLVLLWFFTLPGGIGVSVIQKLAFAYLIIFPIATLLIGYLVNSQLDRIQAESELAESQKQLRQLTAHLQRVREEERVVFAREIHDDFGQRLAVIKMGLAGLVARVPDDDYHMAAQIGNLTAMVDESIHLVRRLFSKLRPGLLDDLGLIPALEWQVQDFENRTGIGCSLSLPEIEMEFSPQAVTDIYRIMQQVLANIEASGVAVGVIVTMVLTPENVRLEVAETRPTGVGENRKVLSEDDLLELRERVRNWRGQVWVDDIQGCLALDIPIAQVKGALV